MKKNILIIMAILLTIVLIPTDIAYAGNSNPEYLDIKINQGFTSSSQTNLSSEDGFYFYNKSNKNNEIFKTSNKNIIVSVNNENLNILNSQKKIIKSIPGNGSVLIGSGSKSNSSVKVGKNPYRDFVTFFVKSGKLNLINHIDIEKYLCGVLPREISPSFPPESIKAQAITARTFAESNKGKHKADGYNLCDGTCCQVYSGLGVEHQNTNKAVNETKGLYVYHNGNLASTFFHSNNGGCMESSKNVWGGDYEYLIVKDDPYSENTTWSTWELEVTNNEFNKKFSEFNKKFSSEGVRIGEILDIEILERSEAHRIKKLKLIGTSGEEIMKGTKLRTILGNTAMKSTWFDVEKIGANSNQSSKVYVYNSKESKPVSIDFKNTTIINGNNIKSHPKTGISKVKGKDKTVNIEIAEVTNPTGFKFRGRGYGHGIGMSQYGAAEMARQGHKYTEIIKHYYNGVEISNKK